MLVFHAILENATEEDALQYVRGMAWGEVESSEQDIAYKRHIEDIDGVGVWYDYGADYYFFTDELPSD